MKSYNPKCDRKEAISLSKRSLDILNKFTSQIEDKLIMQGGDTSYSSKDREADEKELKKFMRYKLDVLFTIHNMLKLENQYSEALTYAKQHSQVSLELFKKNSKPYAYSLLLEAIVMQRLVKMD